MRRPRSTPAPFIDIAGKRFGAVVAVERELNVIGRLVWRYVCDCGVEKRAALSDLTSGKIVSCGCARRQRVAALGRSHRRHGHAGNRSRGRTREYSTWMGMLARCNCVTSTYYAEYGGRGIAVCERWASFDSFLADMGARPTGTTIDRIDVDGDYSPENCRWATWTEQGRNRRNNVIIEHGGRRQSLAAWAAEAGVEGTTIQRRLRRGWSVEQALTMPGGCTLRREDPRRPIPLPAGP